MAAAAIMLPILTLMAIPTPMVVKHTICLAAAVIVSMIIITTATVIPVVTFMDKAAANPAYTVVADIDERRLVMT